MKLKLVSVAGVFVFFLLSTVLVQSQVKDASVIWLRVYGQGSISNLTFGARVANTFGADTAGAFPSTYKEQEPPPPSPGFDCVWKAIRTGQFGGFRGLLDKDFRAWTSTSQKDTFRVSFVQADL